MAQCVDLVRRRGVTEQDIDRIAGDEVDEGEDQHRRRNQRYGRRAGTLQGIGPHSVNCSHGIAGLAEFCQALQEWSAWISCVRQATTGGYLKDKPQNRGR